MKTVKGFFEIKSTPQPDDIAQKIGAMRMLFEKRFEGALEGTSLVMMMGIMNRELGSGGYVAIERVNGRLDGKAGSFNLQHSSLMTRGKPSQSIQVIPDSATQDLQGLSGGMTIDIVEGKHFYTFEYELEPISGPSSKNS